MEEVSKAKHYIAVNAGGRYPLLKTAQDYTEYFHEALSFSDLYETYRYIEKHGLEKIATVITRMIWPHCLRSFILGLTHRRKKLRPGNSVHHKL